VGARLRDRECEATTCACRSSRIFLSEAAPGIGTYAPHDPPPRTSRTDVGSVRSVQGFAAGVDREGIRGRMVVVRRGVRREPRRRARDDRKSPGKSEFLYCSDDGAQERTASCAFPLIYLDRRFSRTQSRGIKPVMQERERGDARPHGWINSGSVRALVRDEGAYLPKAGQGRDGIPQTAPDPHVLHLAAVLRSHAPQANRKGREGADRRRRCGGFSPGEARAVEASRDGDREAEGRSPSEKGSPAVSPRS